MIERASKLYDLLRNIPTTVEVRTSPWNRGNWGFVSGMLIVSKKRSLAREPSPDS